MNAVWNIAPRPRYSLPGSRGLRRSGQQPVVAARHFLAQFDLFGEYLHLGQQHRRLQGIHAAVEADPHIGVLVSPLAVHTDRKKLVPHFPTVREDHAAVTVAAQRLGREKAGACDLSQRPRFFAFLTGAEALGSVFQHEQPYVSAMA